MNERIGRLKERYPGIGKQYEIKLDYDKEKDTVSAIRWFRKAEKAVAEESSHGKYLLQTNMDDTDEVNIWNFYNVIRTVEKTFRILKTDLDIRPVYHKSDDGIKAHLHLAILAYWVVSLVQYELRKSNLHVDWGELVRIMSTQVVVSTCAQTPEGGNVEIRQCTEAEEKLMDIYQRLRLPEKPIKQRKYVWHPDPPNKKNSS